MVTRYLGCGHVGRENNAPSAKTVTFIRVAEIRESLQEDSGKCPLHTNGQ